MPFRTIRGIGRHIRFHSFQQRPSRWVDWTAHVRQESSRRGKWIHRVASETSESEEDVPMVEANEPSLSSTEMTQSVTTNNKTDKKTDKTQGNHDYSSRFERACLKINFKFQPTLPPSLPKAVKRRRISALFIRKIIASEMISQV